MSKALKWFFGIALVLILMGAMFALGYAWQTRMAGGWDAAPFDRAWQHPMMRGDWDQRGPWKYPPMKKYAPYPMPVFGFVPFGGFFLLGGLVKFALFAGLLYGAYWLGRRNARIALDPLPSAPVDASLAPAVEPPPPSGARKK